MTGACSFINGPFCFIAQHKSGKASKWKNFKVKRPLYPFLTTFNSSLIFRTRSPLEVAVSGKLLVITQHFYCCSIDTESLLNLYLHTTFSFNVSVEIEFGLKKKKILTIQTPTRASFNLYSPLEKYLQLK